MSVAIQTLLAAIEATPRTLPATMINQPFVECTVAEKTVRIIPKEEDGTRIKERDVYRGTEMTELTVKLLIRPVYIGMWLVPALGTPVNALHSGSTDAYDHTSKMGGTGLKTMGLQYLDGESWRQALGAVIDSLDIEYVSEKMAEVTVKLLSLMVDDIAAPTVPAISVPSWSKAYDVPTQAVTLNGSAYNKLQKLGVHIKNNRAADFVVGSVDPLEFDEGDANVTFDIDSVSKTYAGSLYKAYVDNTNPGPLAFTLTGASNITGNAFPPSLVLTIHKPGLSDGKKTKKGGRVTESVKGTALKDDGAATSLTALWTDMTPAYAGT